MALELLQQGGTDTYHPTKVWRGHVREPQDKGFLQESGAGTSMEPAAAGGEAAPWLCPKPGGWQRAVPL